MTQEDKQLLLKDLSARFPYDELYVYIEYEDDIKYEVSFVNTGIIKDLICDEIKRIRPYLRPMSNMTYEERQDAREKFFDGSDHYDIDDIGEIYADTYQPYTTVYTLSFARLSGYIDWLNEHHFDYRGLIDRGLAIEASEGMYKTE